MTGWNMPPGCNVSDIPGNSKEDQEAEAFWDNFFEAEESIRKSLGHTGDEYVGKLCEHVWALVGEAYAKGRADAIAEDQQAKEVVENFDEIKYDPQDTGTHIKGDYYTQLERNESATDTAKRKGMEARFEGVPIEACPYPPGGILMGVWEQAWLDTNKELTSKPGHT